MHVPTTSASNRAKMIFVQAWYVFLRPSIIDCFFLRHLVADTFFCLSLDRSTSNCTPYCDTAAPAILKEDRDHHKRPDARAGDAPPSLDFALKTFGDMSKMEYSPDDTQYDGTLSIRVCDSQWKIGNAEIQLTETGQRIFGTKALVRVNTIIRWAQHVNLVV
jgi:hypothetical protein